MIAEPPSKSVLTRSSAALAQASEERRAREIVRKTRQGETEGLIVAPNLSTPGNGGTKKSRTFRCGFF
jgi:hypothetical protein